MAAGIVGGVAARPPAVAQAVEPRPAPSRCPTRAAWNPIGSARMQFDVRFYLIAILFLVFDVGTAVSCNRGRVTALRREGRRRGVAGRRFGRA